VAAAGADAAGACAAGAGSHCGRIVTITSQAASATVTAWAKSSQSLRSIGRFGFVQERGQHYRRRCAAGRHNGAWLPRRCC
jgi:hypothetical protein